MVARDLRFVVLGEDNAHLNFVRRWLLVEGVQARQITLLPHAAASLGGAGEQYVRERYAAEVHSYRARANRQRIALVVVIDADTGTVQERQAALDRTLDMARTPGERIAVLVPRRNIETWLTALLYPERSDLDETKQFKSEFPPRDSAEACKRAASKFTEFLGSEKSRPAIPSLAAARQEARRLV